MADDEVETGGPSTSPACATPYAQTFNDPRCSFWGGGGRAGEEIRTKEHPIFLNVIGTKKAKSFKRPKRSVCEPVRS